MNYLTTITYTMPATVGNPRNEYEVKFVGSRFHRNPTAALRAYFKRQGAEKPKEAIAIRCSSTACL